LDPTDSVALFNIGIAYEGVGDLDKSLAAFRRAAEIKPSYVNAYYNLGTLFMKMGRYDEAIQSLNRVIELNPQFSDAHYNIAASYAQMSDKSNAVSWLRNAVALNPRLADEALKDEDFRKIWSEADFKALTDQVVHPSEKSNKNR
jgi:tetratricopeptide (TPR) repeat protein